MSEGIQKNVNIAEARLSMVALDCKARITFFHSFVRNGWQASLFFIITI
jgi:hypothetical protein